MKSSRLYEQMKNAGFGYRSCAAKINAASGSSVAYFDVYYFVHGKTSKIGRARRKVIRDFFISKHWISKPKKRKPPVCRKCGCEYPTRKLLKRNSTVHHKQPTKF